MKVLIAKIISNTFNPFILLPVFYIVIYANGLISLHEVVIVFGIHIVAPLVLMGIFMKTKSISDYEITKREERGTYFTLITVLFGISIYFVRANELLLSMTITATMLLFLVTAISYKWKISGHMALDTFLLSVCIVLNPYLLILFPLLPLVAWSRIVLNKHTLHQTLAGSSLGFLVFIFVNTLISML